MAGRLWIYDTTLRDGAQMQDISFATEEKLLILEKLDGLGIAFVEGGWPGSNPKDREFFRKAKSLTLKTRIVPFGSTRRRRIRVSQDPNLKALLQVEQPTVAIVGNAWAAYAREALKVSLDTNLRMVSETVSFLKKADREVFFDAEHFFEGMAEDEEYVLKVLREVCESGADCLVLCDTNGGALPDTIREGVRKVREAFPSVRIGIHCHNDSGCAVANTLVAAQEGASILQGTINGYGERCGNADICSVIAGVELKMGRTAIGHKRLGRLREISHVVDELLNMVPHPRQPYVGMNAFAHKAGIHASAVTRSSRMYEHVDPSRVGNARRFVVSELAGKSNLFVKAREFGLDETRVSSVAPDILKTVKDLENEGYQFEGAEASLELLMRKALGKHRRFFDLKGFRVIVEKREDNSIFSEATIKVSVGGQQKHTAAEGEGPVNALDNALRKALESFYPSLRQMHLKDFKVRVINARLGTKAKVRVIIESADLEETWNTVGVSENIIEASWQALVDGVEYKLLREGRDKHVS